MAAYDSQTGILFLHVPKTGGSSIVHSLFNTMLTYDRPKDELVSRNVSLEKFGAIAENGKLTEDCFVFSTVRDPYERFYSFYYTHMITKRRVEPTEFSEDSFENFIIYDWQPYIKSKITSRKDSQDPQRVCRDANFKAWVKRDPLVPRKVCQNIYKKYYCVAEDKCQPGIRFLLFDNIQEEYRKMLDYSLREDILCADEKSPFFNEKNLETLEKRIHKEKMQIKRKNVREIQRIVRIIDEGLRLVNIAPTRGGSQLANTRNPALVARPAIDFYTPKARKVFDRFNQEDIEFYNKLKNMTFEERFETPLLYSDLVKDD